MQVELSVKSAAHKNLNGYFGTVVGTNASDNSFIAVKLDNHPTQEAAYLKSYELAITVA